MKKLLTVLLVFCCTAVSALAQTTITLPIAANVVADIGNGPIKVRMVAGNASIFTSQGSGVGSTSGASTALTLTATPATPPIVGGLISGSGIVPGTAVSAYNGTTGITLSAAMNVAGGTAVAWGAACPSTSPSSVIQASPQADYYIMYTQARVCAVSPGGPVNTLLIDPIFYDQTSPNSGGSVAVNPVDYGADPTCTRDSAGAFNLALAASTYVKFPPGHFCFSSKITYAIKPGSGVFRPSLTLEGSGIDVTTLDWNNSTDGIEIDYPNNLTGATFRGFSIETNQTSGGTAFTLNLAVANNNANQRITLIDSVDIRGEFGSLAWLNAFVVHNVSNVTLQNTMVNCLAGVGTGMSFAGDIGLSSQAVGFTIQGGVVNGCGVGIKYGPNAQGLYISNWNTTSDTIGVQIPPGLASLTELTITNSQIAVLPGGIGVDLESGTSAFTINNTLFIIQAGGTGILVNAAIGDSAIIGNPLAQTSPGTGTGISIQAGQAISVIGNSTQGFAVGIAIGGTADLLAVSGNMALGNTAALTYTASGTHNQIYGNPGYNPVGITAAATLGASPVTVTAGPTPETHYVKQSANFNAAVTKGGNALCTTPSANVPCVIDLAPNEAMVVTWTTTAPTDTKDVH